jgi:hypothetical protein
MQPNKAFSHWGGMATLVTVLLVLGVLSVGLIALGMASGDGGTDDGEMTGHACVTIGSDGDLAAGDFVRDGSLRRATERQTVCRPHDELDHPRLVQALVDVRPLPVVLAVLGCLIGLRRVIEGTRDDGPFSTEAVYRLRRLRPWATAFVFAGVTAYWALGGVADDLVADASWPSDAGMLWPPLGTYVAFTVLARVCEFGTSQRMAAYERGQAVVAEGL